MLLSEQFEAEYQLTKNLEILTDRLQQTYRELVGIITLHISLNCAVVEAAGVPAILIVIITATALLRGGPLLMMYYFAHPQSPVSLEPKPFLLLFSCLARQIGVHPLPFALLQQLQHKLQSKA